jgi:hypothetical protein
LNLAVFSDHTQFGHIEAPDLVELLERLVHKFDNLLLPLNWIRGNNEFFLVSVITQSDQKLKIVLANNPRVKNGVSGHGVNILLQEKVVLHVTLIIVGIVIRFDIINNCLS